MPKKSKKDEPCYTRTNKAGQKYVTCEGEQKRNKKLAKEIKTLTSDKPKPKPKPKSKPKATPKPKAKPATKKPAPKKTTGEVKKPKGVPPPDKDMLQAVMAVMTDVAKEKGKSSKQQIDSRVALDKKLQSGKLSYKEFEYEAFNNGDSDDRIRGFEDDMAETQGYNMGYWVSRVSKRAETWDELTENQKERLQDIMAKDINVMTRKKMRAFYEKFVKGKKFKNFKEVVSVLKKEYDEVTFKH